MIHVVVHNYPTEAGPVDRAVWLPGVPRVGETVAIGEGPERPVHAVMWAIPDHEEDPTSSVGAIAHVHLGRAR